MQQTGQLYVGTVDMWHKFQIISVAVATDIFDIPLYGESRSEALDLFFCFLFDFL